MIYAGCFIPTATAGAQPTGDEATAIPFLKRFTSPIPSTVKICRRQIPGASGPLSRVREAGPPRTKEFDFGPLRLELVRQAA